MEVQRRAFDGRFHFVSVHDDLFADVLLRDALQRDPFARGLDTQLAGLVVDQSAVFRDFAQVHVGAAAVAHNGRHPTAGFGDLGYRFRTMIKGNPVLRRREAAAYVGMSTSLLLQVRKADPTFPVPIMITETLIGWRRHELDAWLDARPRCGSALTPA